MFRRWLHNWQHQQNGALMLQRWWREVVSRIRVRGVRAITHIHRSTHAASLSEGNWSANAGTCTNLLPDIFLRVVLQMRNISVPKFRATSLGKHSRLVGAPSRTVGGSTFTLTQGMTSATTFTFTQGTTSASRYRRVRYAKYSSFVSLDSSLKAACKVWVGDRKLLVGYFTSPYNTKQLRGVTGFCRCSKRCRDRKGKRFYFRGSWQGDENEDSACVFRLAVVERGECILPPDEPPQPGGLRDTVS